MITQNGTILLLKTDCENELVSIDLKSSSQIDSVEFSIKDPSGREIVKKEKDVKSSSAVLDEKVKVERWSVSNPVLYSIKLKIKFLDQSSEIIEDKFGFRTLRADENYIYLNDKPFFVRGIIRGHKAHEHDDNCKLGTYEFYKKGIIEAKKFGFNAIRFHTTLPPEECFRAADDCGMMLHVELRDEQEVYNNLVEMRHPKTEFISDVSIVEEIVQSLYNHPSLMTYCVSNEIGMPGRNEGVKKIGKLVKKLDETRLYVDSSAYGEYDREGVDLDVQHMGYFFPYVKHADMYSTTYNLNLFGSVKSETASEGKNAVISKKLYYKRPVIAHEVLHYTALRDFKALKEKILRYDMPMPWWVDEELKMIEAKGLSENYDKLYKASKDFQFQCWKIALERLRESTFLQGSYMLQFADTDKYENSNGLVDCFDDDVNNIGSRFSVFNDDTVLLAHLERQLFWQGEKISIPFILSDYSDNSLGNSAFSFEVLNGDEVCANGELKDIEPQDKKVYEICKADIELPILQKKSANLKIKAKLTRQDQTVIENSWDIWVFKKEESNKLNCKIDMQQSYISNYYEGNPQSNLTVTDKIDDNLFKRLDSGEDVLLIYRTDWTRHILHKDMAQPKYSFRHTWNRFKPVIWERGTNQGGIIDAEKLNKFGFATEDSIDFRYYDLMEDCDKITLDDFPVKVNSIVSGTDKCVRDRFDTYTFNLHELMYDRVLRKFSYLFELKVGKGRLLVCGFNFTGIEQDSPSAKSMLTTLIDYCNSESFAPSNTIKSEELADYMCRVANEGPQIESIMTQYWQLDETFKETGAFFEEAERYVRSKMNK